MSISAAQNPKEYAEALAEVFKKIQSQKVLYREYEAYSGPKGKAHIRHTLMAPNPFIDF